MKSLGWRGDNVHDGSCTSHSSLMQQAVSLAKLYVLHQLYAVSVVLYSSS